MADVLTNVGIEWVADALAGAVATTGQYIAWGTGAGTADATDTALFTEASESRVSGTVSRTGSGSTSKYQVTGTMTCAGSGKTITNAGNFTASSGGTLIMHSDFSGITLEVGDSIAFTWTLAPS